LHFTSSNPGRNTQAHQACKHIQQSSPQHKHEYAHTCMSISASRSALRSRCCSSVARARCWLLSCIAHACVEAANGVCAIRHVPLLIHRSCHVLARALHCTCMCGSSTCCLRTKAAAAYVCGQATQVLPASMGTCPQRQRQTKVVEEIGEKDNMALNQSV